MEHFVNASIATFSDALTFFPLLDALVGFELAAGGVLHYGCIPQEGCTYNHFFGILFASLGLDFLGRQRVG